MKISKLMLLAFVTMLPKFAFGAIDFDKAYRSLTKEDVVANVKFPGIGQEIPVSLMYKGKTFASLDEGDIENAYQTIYKDLIVEDEAGKQTVNPKVLLAKMAQLAAIMQVSADIQTKFGDSVTDEIGDALAEFEKAMIILGKTGMNTTEYKLFKQIVREGVEKGLHEKGKRGEKAAFINYVAQVGLTIPNNAPTYVIGGTSRNALGLNRKVVKVAGFGGMPLNLTFKGRTFAEWTAKTPDVKGGAYIDARTKILNKMNADRLVYEVAVMIAKKGIDHKGMDKFNDNTLEFMEKASPMASEPAMRKLLDICNKNRMDGKGRPGGMSLLAGCEGDSKKRNRTNDIYRKHNMVAQ